jgi:hypothetical protein
LSNLLIYKNGVNEVSTIEKVLSRTVTLSFHFEG